MRHVSRRHFLRGTLGVAAGAALGSAPAAARARQGGAVREYWVVARSRRWVASPTGRDEWHGKRVPKVRFDALSYELTEPGFGKPLGPRGIGDNAGMPGPVLRASPGDELVVHFRNLDRRWRRPHTMHPHGVAYTPDHDGSFMGHRHTPPGGAVAYGQTHTYRWTAGPDSVGVWPYHDHGPYERESTEAGLFGAIVITPRDEPPPHMEATIYFHQLNPSTTDFERALSAINGRVFAGNTPTVTSRVGQDVAFNVLTLGNEPHTFHIHGHRWQDATRSTLDNAPISPAQGLRARFREDAPGRWLYHCHLTEHMHMGMVGFYVVAPS